MHAWLTQRPGLGAGDKEAALRQWLEEFPSLARSDLGRAFNEVARSFPDLEGAGAARLAEFYATDLFRAMAPLFRERLRELRARWGEREAWPDG